MVEMTCKLPAWASTCYEPPKSSMLPPLGFSAPFIPPTWQEDLVLIAAFLGREQSGALGAGDKADGRRQDLPILGVSWPVSPLIKLLLEQHLEPQILKTLTRGQPLVFGVSGVQWSLLATLAKGSDQPHPRVTIQESLPRCGFLPIKQAISSLAHMRPSLTLYPL